MPDEVASREEAFRYLEVGDHDHGDMTQGAFPFMRDGVADDLGDHNEDVDHGDTKLDSTYHVDNCRIGESLENVNRLYAEAADALRPGGQGLGVTLQRFGALLHIVQDFYAHTNWIEQSGDIAHSGDWFWPAASGGSRFGDAVVLSNPMPSELAWVPGAPENPRVPVVEVDGEVFSGLMSGTYEGNDDPSICPSDVAIPHGPFLTATLAESEYLAKDAPLSHHHEAAIELAAEQTRIEVCRLERIILLRAGAPAHETWLAGWVNDVDALRARCGDPAPVVTGLWMAVM